MHLVEIFGSKRSKRIADYEFILRLDYDRALMMAEHNHGGDNFGDTPIHTLTENPKYGRGNQLTIKNLNKSRSFTPPSKNLSKALSGKQATVVKNSLSIYGIPVYLVDVNDTMVTVAEDDLTFIKDF